MGSKYLRSLLYSMTQASPLLPALARGPVMVLGSHHMRFLADAGVLVIFLASVTKCLAEATQGRMGLFCLTVQGTVSHDGEGVECRRITSSQEAETDTWLLLRFSLLFSQDSCTQNVTMSQPHCPIPVHPLPTPHPWTPSHSQNVFSHIC